MFNKARLELTFWYVLTFLIISLSVSGVFYQRIATILDTEFNRIGQRISTSMEERAGANDRQLAERLQLARITAEDIQLTKQRIARQLIFINVGLTVVIAMAGFWLSGKTLEPIQEAMEQQRRFVGDAAHELRTPLTALKTSLEVNLMDNSLSKKVKIYLEENLTDVNALEDLTNSLLRLAKVDEHGLQIEKESLVEIVEQAIKQTKKQALEKKIEIKLKPTDRDIQVFADRGVLIDVFLILLDNAVKYSPEKTTITIEFFSSIRHVGVRVTDQGRGIAKHHLPHIFERFYRVDSARSQEGGFGLGLSLAQKIVDEHHGSLYAESKLNEGTSFTVKLPKILK